MHPRAEVADGVGVQAFDFEIVDAGRGRVQTGRHHLQLGAGQRADVIARTQRACNAPAERVVARRARLQRGQDPVWLVVVRRPQVRMVAGDAIGLVPPVRVAAEPVPPRRNANGRHHRGR